MRPDPDPLILSLLLDDAAQDWFDATRRAYFPPERLVVGAHVTMFHELPGEFADEVTGAVREACASVKQFPVRVTGLRFLGRGVAFTLAAPEALQLRAAIAASFEGVLSAQDRAGWSPHVTVQNKVPPETARRCLAQLREVGWPQGVEALGVGIWRYRRGPWEEIARQMF